MSTQSASILDIDTYKDVEQPSLVKQHVLEEQSVQDGKPLFSKALAGLVTLLKAKDIHLYQHSYRVQFFTRQLILELNLPEHRAKAIKLAALFHDIGKIGIPDQILKKSSSLTKLEFSKIKEHPTLGAHLLGRIPLFEEIIPSVHAHHERWDGNGYPNGLRGEAIPLGARIVAIADAFEVMTSSHRPYQSPMLLSEALEELRRCAGTQFDPLMVEIFCRNLDTDFQAIVS